MEPVLHLDHVSKVYSNGRGAKNITFTVNRGEVVGLLGPNGSGKTTIMKAVTGLCQPTSGKITVFGADAVDQREEALAKVGALIEQPALYENLTAWDHLVMAGRYYPNVDQARMEKVLEIVGLAPYKKERCGKFSLGMKQRMGLALAL
ncbi:MAG: ABC transporter ATP-binding protein, partial [Ruminiclostridium sp.]|nr:ABC transporter ATP-binding protein [Ruminiclostridium sp.]